MVNAGIADHPVDGHPAVAFVARPGAKLANLRARSRATLVFRSGWEWAGVHGPVELVGPDDPYPALNEHDGTTLLRTIHAAAVGQHPDLDAYDRAMRAERRCAVLLTPERFSTNPPGAEHREPEERA